MLAHLVNWVGKRIISTLLSSFTCCGKDPRHGTTFGPTGLSTLALPPTTLSSLHKPNGRKASSNVRRRSENKFCWPSRCSSCTRPTRATDIPHFFAQATSPLFSVRAFHPAQCAQTCRLDGRVLGHSGHPPLLLAAELLATLCWNRRHCR